MESEVIELYTSKVRKSDYFTKYNPLPSCPVKKYNYTWENYDFPRCICILDFIEWIQKYNIEVDDLGCTFEDPELEFIKYKTKTVLLYPPHDLHKPLPGMYDFFLFNQTIEHLYNPFEAVKNIYNCLKPGGYVFTSVPTINIPHMVPFHFNGYTPIGLAMLFKVNNFDILEIGQWGNYYYIQQLFKTHSWPGLVSLQENIQNEERNVCQCWILAQKPFSKI
jgi:SAM-dependent methyltransferase